MVMKRITILFGVVCLGLLAGCNPQANEAKPPSTPTNAPAAEPVAPAPATTRADEKECFACKGEGTIKCLLCVNGQVDCPGKCLRLNRGVWIHMDVAGHPPTDVWQKFELGGGRYTAFSQAHVGHVIAIQGGQAVDTGACPVCGGTTKVACKACQGTGKQACPICEGKKSVPPDWSPTNNPWLNRQPDLIRLADGRILFGKVSSVVGGAVSIRTRDGKYVHVKTSDIVSPLEGVTTNAVTR